MTVKQFAVKYDIPLGRVKAAMGHRKSGINTNYEAAIEYEEGKIASEVFHYLFQDMRACMRTNNRWTGLSKYRRRKAMEVKHESDYQHEHKLHRRRMQELRGIGHRRGKNRLL